ncbi:transposase, partial [Enterocloster citroniae]|uniref:transposase n=1 Tax=Enterocloster citroniae TaxID=358743 RepID=UPI00207AFD53
MRSWGKAATAIPKQTWKQPSCGQESHTNIQSEEEILKRHPRSVQTEGHFGDIKENENFRRFNYRSEEKV